MTINRVFQSSQAGLAQAREALERSADRISRWGYTGKDGTLKRLKDAPDSEDAEKLDTASNPEKDIDLLEEVVNQNKAATAYRANATVMRMAQEAYQSMERVGRRR